MEATTSLNNLWSQILALPASDRQWLRNKLDVYEEEEEERLAPYTIEEINAWIDDFEAELEAGEPGYTLEEFDTQMRKEHGWR